MPDEIRIVDIARADASQARRRNGALDRADPEAATARAPLRINVEKMNPALQLYERLGFKPIEDREVYWFLEIAPN